MAPQDLNRTSSLPGNLKTGSDPDDTIRFRHYSLFCALGLPTMLAFAMYNYFKGNVALALLLCVSVSSLSVGWIFLKRIKRAKILYRFNALLFGSLLLYMTYIGGDEGSRVLWMYTFPPIAFFLMGRVEGAAWSIMLFLCSLPLLTTPWHWPQQHTYSTEFTVRFLISFVIVSCITYFYEHFRYRFKVNIEQKNKDLETEISNKEHIAESLRQSEERYRAIYLQASEGILLIDDKGIIVESNPQMLEMLGYDEKELIGIDILSLIHPEDIKKTPLQISRLQAGETVTLERQLRTADDVYLYFEMSGRMISNDLILLLYRDVTERKFAEIALEKANKKLERQANIDGLTQIANRRMFDSAFRREWRRMRREKMPLTLILADIDFFKPYNDIYGHHCGDDCLRSVAGIMAARVFRAGDLVARFGGEEFAVILPNTDLQGGIVVAESMREAISRRNIPHKGSQVSGRVTMSFGVASTQDFTENDYPNLIELADKALYHAKNGGRNRVSAGG